MGGMNKNQPSKGRSYRRTSCLNFQIFLSRNCLYFHIFHFLFQILECEPFQNFSPLLNVQILEMFPVFPAFPAFPAFLGKKGGIFGKQLLDKNAPKVVGLKVLVTPRQSDQEITLSGDVTYQ